MRFDNAPRDEPLAERLNDVGGLELAGYTDGQALTADQLTEYRPVPQLLTLSGTPPLQPD
jgi:hypothetical protein